MFETSLGLEISYFKALEMPLLSPWWGSHEALTNIFRVQVYGLKQARLDGQHRTTDLASSITTVRWYRRQITLPHLPSLQACLLPEVRYTGG
jgi:hypothetical protein